MELKCVQLCQNATISFRWFVCKWTFCPNFIWIMIWFFGEVYGLKKIRCKLKINILISLHCFKTISNRWCISHWYLKRKKIESSSKTQINYSLRLFLVFYGISVIENHIVSLFETPTITPWLGASYWLSFGWRELLLNDVTLQMNPENSPLNSIIEILKGPLLANMKLKTNQTWFPKII